MISRRKVFGLVNLLALSWLPISEPSFAHTAIATGDQICGPIFCRVSMYVNGWWVDGITTTIERIEDTKRKQRAQWDNGYQNRPRVTRHINDTDAQYSQRVETWRSGAPYEIPYYD
jgi:hypothetical protein